MREYFEILLLLLWLSNNENIVTAHENIVTAHENIVTVLKPIVDCRQTVGRECKYTSRQKLIPLQSINVKVILHF